ncbi:MULTISPECIES: cellulose-binding family II protein [unclassified Pseudoalteromonas]|uniref:cellulose-binding family II protein n=1 Tax=unclassified Pseudoalteromonas TaxID=194690 RepID=UPI0010201CF6|nr:MULTISPECIES: cellulose-binding family II protein [unclassified Pseudoalteromonas]QWV06847.1 cellulose-binding family II protein [Pseudoalteromonas shioyasakiensis]MCG9709557.1 cellulose-binding family II protein [Pseudoalteromonas sp. Isolate3]MCP4587919.1 cellulose-binding family II protein [Pseudoalteromonas sp.]NIZ04430.1 cellulose-binding family II protein [Pseudoalteromonas sp. HF66]RZD20150.1 cellulose-binding family II protein [Pseudoalteromonas sp. MEBiC 03485]
MLASLLLSLTVAQPFQLGTNLPLNAPHNAITHVECIFKQINVPFKLQKLPWLRAKREVQLNRLDGYFTANLLSKMQQYGELSAPMFLENWYWFTHADSASIAEHDLRYGVVRGSHQADWYQLTNRKIEVEVNTTQELIKVFKKQRVDRILLDLEEFEFNAVQLQIKPDEYKQTFYRYVPLGLFAANKTLEEFPEFLNAFNSHISSCSQSPFVLSKIEKQSLVRALFEQIKVLANAELVQQAVKKSNRQLISSEELEQFDNLWEQQVIDNKPIMAESYLKLEGSQFLQVWQRQMQGIITEIIVTDKQGKNVIISAVTTDYWQGDEAKFLNMYQQDDDYYIDTLEFDESTKHFQVQFSVPIFDEKKHQIGVLILGVDVEKALSK